VSAPVEPRPPSGDRSPPLLVIAGATATGKSGLSIRLADALRGEGVPTEIISADARQVYRGLDIGTAKVDRATRERIPHHGIDIVDPDVRYSVAEFADHAASSLLGLAEGGLMLLVGGTGLYLRAVGRGLALDALPSDPKLRGQLEVDLAADGAEAQADRLRAVAPCLASRTDLRNPRRVIRALEIALLRGDGPLPAPLGYAGPSAWLGLDAPTGLHRSWIERRARDQFEQGLVEEARTLRERWDPSLPAFTAIGYHEAWAVLDGTLDKEAAIRLDAQRNVAFARRQRTWFRSEGDIEWLDATVDQLPAAVAAAHRLLRSARRAARVS
jgi:tRNA dimethylallyltransferase